MSETPELPMNEDLVAAARDETEAAENAIDVPAVVERRSMGSLGEWQPSDLAMLSDEEFERRLVILEREKVRVERVKRAILKPDVDYGVIPGTKKPSLYKSGAETFNRLTHFVPEYDTRRETGDGETAPQIRYEVMCVLVDEWGRVRGRGHGSSSTWEVKYRYRNAKRACPECGQETIIKGRKEYGGGWVCWKREGGCGAAFKEGDQRIETQEGGKGENPDPHDLDNTLLQMACKRGYVAATRTAHALSGAFTQDVEDTGIPSDDDVPASGAPQGEPIGEAQVGGLRKAAQARATKLGDPSIGTATIVSDVLKRHGIEALEKVPRSKFVAITKAIATWEPGK